MQNKKKVISVILALIIALSAWSAVPFTANAAEVNTATTGATIDEAYPDFEYDVLDKGTAEIAKYIGEGGDVTIPSTLDGYTVTGIGFFAFEYCTSLTSIAIPDSVTSIGDYAFDGCTELTNIDIPDSVTYIGGSAFYNCRKLTSIDIPDSVTSIGNNAFSDTAWYENQPDGLIYAGKVAYTIKGKCPTEVIIKDGTLGIAQGAFIGCTELMSITVPNSVTSIGDHAFRYYFDDEGRDFPIKSFTIYGYTGSASEKYANDNRFTFVSIGESTPDEATPDEATPDEAAASFEYRVTENSTAEITGYKGKGGDVTIPSTLGGYTVTSIGDYAFEFCESLTRIDIPESVTSIGWYAFSGCTGLTSISIPDSVTNIGGGAFDNTAWYVSQPDGLVYAGKFAYIMKGDCPSTVEIKGGTTGIAGRAFSDCTGLTGIDIPESVTSIGWYAFSGCTSLTSISIPDSVMSIGGFAFSDCAGLTNIVIPDSVTSIGDYAFEGCTGMKSVTIPDSVTSIGGLAFGYNYSVQYRDGMPYITYTSEIDGFTIYGYEGSEAEKYTTRGKNEIPFIPLKDKADKATGIILAVPEDTDLTVKDITSDISSKLPGNFNVLTAYDISLTKDGETVQPENIVPVKIPCSNENAKVFRLEADGTMTDMNAEYKDGYLVFTTDHFSVYVLGETVETPGDVTGDGKTNVQDCTAILRYVRKLDTLTEDQLKRADVTGDGKVNVQDVTRILRHVRKIESLY